MTRPRTRTLMERLEPRQLMSASHGVVTHVLHNNYGSSHAAAPAVAKSHLGTSALVAMMSHHDRPEPAPAAETKAPGRLYVIPPSQQLDYTQPLEVSPDGTTLGSPGAFGAINPSQIIYPYDVTNAQGHPALVYVSPLIPAVYLNGGEQYVIDSVGSGAW